MVGIQDILIRVNTGSKNDVFCSAVNEGSCSINLVYCKRRFVKFSLSVINYFPFF
jgi:hypothetical protein